MLSPWKVLYKRKTNFLLISAFQLVVFYSVYPMTSCKRGTLSFCVIYNFSCSNSCSCDVMKRHTLRPNRSSINGTWKGRVIRIMEKTTQIAPETFKNGFVIIIPIVIFAVHFSLFYSKLLVNLFVGCQKFFTRKKRQQNKTLLSQLSESDAFFEVRQNNQETQFKVGGVQQVKMLL